MSHLKYMQGIHACTEPHERGGVGGGGGGGGITELPQMAFHQHVFFWEGKGQIPILRPTKITQGFSGIRTHAGESES